MRPPIQSAQNPNFKLFSSLLTARGVKKHGLCLVSGRKIVPEVLKDKNTTIKAIVSSAKNNELIDNPDFESWVFENRLFQELDTFNTQFPILVCQVPELKTADLDTPPQGLEVLCALGDPNNLGALIRSCEAFGVSKVILLDESATAFHPKALRSSSGSILRVSLEKGPSINELSASDSLYSLDMQGKDISEVQWPKDLRLLLGEEGQGLPQNISNIHKVKIPISSSVESLNATVAGSIALYQIKNN